MLLKYTLCNLKFKYFTLKFLESFNQNLNQPSIIFNHQDDLSFIYLHRRKLIKLILKNEMRFY